jgi:Rha family phage regulatory protein
MSNIAEIVKWREDTECVEAFTTSLVIAEKFGKQHKVVIKKIESLDGSTKDWLQIMPMFYEDNYGRQQPMYRLNRDAFAFIAMGFTGRKADEWKLKFLEAFNKMEQHLKRIMKKGWLEHRSEAALEYRAMSKTLQHVRALDGKETKAFHYANEAKLVNRAMTGEYANLNRDELSPFDLKILCELQLHNAALIGAGVPSKERKILLQDHCRSFALKLGGAS